MLMQEVITKHKFLKVYQLVMHDGVLMGKADLPENAASAKQCQADVKWFHSLLLPPSGFSSSTEFLKVFQH